MPISFTTLQIYDQYLTTYRSRDNDFDVKNSRRSSRHATHDAEELKDIYSTIQWKNRFAPLYMADPSPKSIAFAVHLKESANGLKQTIDSLSGENDELFSMKTAYSDNESLASVEYVAEDAEEEDVPQNFTLEVEHFATPQTRQGLRNNHVFDRPYWITSLRGNGGAPCPAVSRQISYCYASYFWSSSITSKSASTTPSSAEPDWPPKPAPPMSGPGPAPAP